MYKFQYKNVMYVLTCKSYKKACELRELFGKMTLGDAFLETGNPIKESA